VPRKSHSELGSHQTWWPSCSKPLQDETHRWERNWCLVAGRKPLSLRIPLFVFRHELWSALPWSESFPARGARKKRNRQFCSGEGGMLPEDKAESHAFISMHTPQGDSATGRSCLKHVQAPLQVRAKRRRRNGGLSATQARDSPYRRIGVAVAEGQAANFPPTFQGSDTVK